MTAIQNNDSYIGELLVRDGLITGEDLRKGLDEQKKTRGFLCSTLVQLGYASEEKIFSILSLQIGVPFVNLQDIKIDFNLIGRIPGNFALAFKFFPIKEADGMFYIAMSDPLSSTAIDEIKSYLGINNIRVFLAGDNEIRKAIKANYGI